MTRLLRAARLYIRSGDDDRQAKKSDPRKNRAPRAILGRADEVIE
jgi:hypothetical protein